MKTLLLVIPFVVSCGPMGNTLGLEGTYRGVATSEGGGQLTQYSGGQSTVFDSNVVVEKHASFTIEAGYTSDAVITGGSCPVSLNVSGDKLTMSGDTDCNEMQDSTTTSGAASVVLKTYIYTTFKTVEVEKTGEGEVRVFMKSDYTREKFQDEEKTEEMKLEMEVTFDGTRVAGEGDGVL